MTDKELGTAAGEIFAKAFTLGYKTGRTYIPAGGMALTAEQVEDVRALVWLDGRRNFDAFHRLRALFPATEPAEEVKPVHPKPDVGDWGYGGGAAVYAPEVRGKTREELLSEKVEQLQAQVKHLSRVAVNAAEHGIKAPSGSLKPCGYCHSTEATLLHACTNCGAMTSDPWSHPAPAEPAEEVTGLDIGSTDAEQVSGNSSEIPNSSPAPAVPAEEETKAATWQEKVADLESQLEEEIANRDAWEQRLTNLIYSLATVGEVGEWTSSDDLDEKFIDHIGGKIQQLERAALAARGEGWYEGYEVGLEYGPIAASGEEYDGPINPYDVPASSPVAPAPTETGPWQRIEDVPEGVLQIKDRHGRTWLMVGGTWRFEWHDGNWHEPHTNINAQAPFVAAKEG